jgi:hypothetical protein
MKGVSREAFPPIERQQDAVCRRHGGGAGRRSRRNGSSRCESSALSTDDHHFIILVRSAGIRLTDEEGGTDHVDISPERDTLAHGTAGGPRPGSGTSWRDTPQSTVTLQVLSWVLLVCLGLLLGTTWATQALQPKLRQQAEERRRLNEEWSAVRADRRHGGECSRCGSLLSERDWYFAPTIVQDRPDED